MAKQKPVNQECDPEDFWKTIPLEELAKRQGVKPVLDLDELASLWPADDDPEDLLRFILAERAHRRDAA